MCAIIVPWRSFDVCVCVCLCGRAGLLLLCLFRLIEIIAFPQKIRLQSRAAYTVLPICHTVNEKEKTTTAIPCTACILIKAQNYM